jgi:hypothetical protein
VGLGFAAAAPGAALADEQPRVAVEKLGYPGVGDAEQRKLLHAIDEGIGFANARQASAANHKYAFEKSKELFTDECLANAQCWQQTIELLNVEMTLSGTLTRTGAGWDADLSLYARDLRRVAGHKQFPCPGCSLDTFADRVRDTVVDMVRSNIQLPRGTLMVHTAPAGAEVRVDGRIVGSAPVEIPETAGQHTVIATLPNREEQRAVVQLDPQGSIEVEMKLPLKAAPPPVLPPVAAETWTPRNLKIAGWTLVGAGVAGIIIGAALVGIDGHDAGGQHENPSGILVHDQYTTAASGGGIIAIGAVVGLVSVVPFYFAHRKESAAKLRASVGPHGATVGIDGSF